MDIQSTDIKGRPEWYFYFLWVVLNGLTFPTAFFFSIPILYLIERFVGSTVLINGTERLTEDYLLIYFLLPLFTILTGISQYLLLSRRINKISNWIWITGIIWPLILFVFGFFLSGFFRLTNYTPPESLAFLYYGWIGLVLGVIQWLVLRRKFMYSGLWIVASFLGWMAIPAIIGYSVNYPFEMFAIPSIPAIFTAFGLWILFFLSPEPLEQNI